MNDLQTIDDYFKAFAKHHVAKSTALLDPLHVPGRDPLPDVSDLLRQPFEAQHHVIAALVQALDERKSAILAAEMGTGKTIQSIGTVHAHAGRSYRKGGRRGRYRAMVLCPDHLIMKWKDEIEQTVPGAVVTTFDETGGGCKQLLTDMIRLYTSLRDTSSAIGPKRWREPDGPEWFVLGKDQSKLMPGVSALGGLRRGFRGDGFEHGSSVRKVVTYTDKEGNEVKAKDRVYQCPRCGSGLMDKDGKPIELSPKKMASCGRKIGVEVAEDGKGIAAPRLWTGKDLQKVKPGSIVTRWSDNKKYRVQVCGEPLWQYTTQPKRWAPAAFLSRKCPKLFDYLIADEVHQQKSKTTAQANAFGMMAAQSRNVLSLTGTLIGGYARDIFYLLLRTDAQSLQFEGFGWGQDLNFTREYGRIEKTVTTRTSIDGNVTVSRGSRMSLAKDDDEKEAERPAPGIMPALFGRHLIGRTAFLALDDLADNLPKLREYVGGPPEMDYDEEDEAFYCDTAIEMSPELDAAYREVENRLANACDELMRKGSMKLLGQLLVATLGYPDLPFGWKAPTGVEEHKACGYWDKPGIRTTDNWVGVVQPADLPRDVVYPKEQALLDIVAREVAARRQVWVYVQMTDKRDVRARLAKLLQERGYRTAILRSGGKGGPKPKDRLAWIAKEGSKADVIISHPQLVETGIDFFKRMGDGYAYNFPSIVFYETGYNIFTLRQAARRAWRIGQDFRCRVYYLYYRGTGQERAMKLIARKMEAALQLDGELSAEGLASMSDDQSAAMALARSIAGSIDDTDIARSWTKVGVKPAIAKAPDRVLAAVDGGPIQGIDILSMQAELIAQTLLDHDAASPTITPAQLHALYEQFDPEGWLDDLDDLDFDPDELLSLCQ